MAEYLITSSAPRRIGNNPNTGVGTVIELAEGYADAFVAMGWLLPKDVQAVTAEEIAGDPENRSEEKPQVSGGAKGSPKAARATGGQKIGV